MTGRPVGGVLAVLSGSLARQYAPRASRRSGRVRTCRVQESQAPRPSRGCVQYTGSATTCFRSTSTTGSTRSNGRVGTRSWLRASSDKPAKIPRSASASPRGWPGITSRRASPCTPPARCSTRGARPFACRPSARRSACSIVGWRCCVRRTPRGRRERPPDQSGRGSNNSCRSHGWSRSASCVGRSCAKFEDAPVQVAGPQRASWMTGPDWQPSRQKSAA